MKQFANHILFNMLLMSLGLLITQLTFAEGENAIFTAANDAFVAGDYPAAQESYESLLAEGYSSSDLYYNLGNVHYKLGHIAPSILNYERALKLDPSHKDAEFNLRLANLRVVDNLKPVPRLFLMQWILDWYGSRSAGQWAQLSLILIWLAMGLGAAFLMINHPIIKRIGFFGGIILLAGSLLTTGISLSRLSTEENDNQGDAIIFTPNAYVKDAPEGKTDLLILHEGVKVQMEDQIGNWIKISLDDANIGDVVGFVEADAIRKI
ncbi:MAG: tetratricopeptide repeat protein [Bacteroidota bacterium]